MTKPLVPRSTGRGLRRALAPVAATVLLVMTAACAPGFDAPSGERASGPVSTDVGTEPVELALYNSQGSKSRTDALIAGFEKEFPNITITPRYDPDNVTSQNLPRVLSSTNPPDLAPAASIVDSVQNGLLLNLDPYSEAYGWDELPPSQLAGTRVSSEGVQGRGSLYAVPDGFTLAGVYHNKKLADRIGMTTPPRSIDEFEALLAKAKAAGLTPIITAGQLGLGTTAFQNLLNDYAGPKKVNDWIYRVPGASIDTPEGVEAATVLDRWIKAGYFNSDANATGQDSSYGRFAEGESVFMFQGNWAAPLLTPTMGDDLGFFPFPAETAGGQVAAMSGPGTPYAISARSKHPDAAAAFLNWLRSDAARAIVVEQGLAPFGSAEQALPPVEAGSVDEEIQKSFQRLSAADGLVDFVQNATSGIQVNAWVPESQLLFSGRTSPEGFVAAVQTTYENEGGR